MHENFSTLLKVQDLKTGLKLDLSCKQFMQNSATKIMCNTSCILKTA